MKLGIALDLFNRLDDDDIWKSKKQPSVMSREFIQWIYNGKDRPDWVPEEVENHEPE
jgi:hypothetical protein